MSKSSPFPILAFLSAVTLAGVLLLTVSANRARTIKEEEAPLAEVAIEHEKAATLSVHQSTGKGEGIIEFSAEGSDTAISVPETWQRREVRGGTLDRVTADPPSLGFTRWTLPSGITVSFRAEGNLRLVVRNASPTPLLVLGKRVDVVTGKTDERSILIKEKAEALW
jgi:hypothetical protein